MSEEKLSEDACASMVQDFASFVRVDMTPEYEELDESIENMLAKLEEFGYLMDMIERHGTVYCETVQRVFASRQDLQQLFGRIDALETFVERAGSQLSSLEAQVERAERELGVSTATGGIGQALSALFQGKKSESPPENPEFTPPEIFRTEDHFHHRTEGREDST